LHTQVQKLDESLKSLMKHFSKIRCKRQKPWFMTAIRCGFNQKLQSVPVDKWQARVRPLSMQNRKYDHSSRRRPQTVQLPMPVPCCCSCCLRLVGKPESLCSWDWDTCNHTQCAIESNITVILYDHIITVFSTTQNARSTCMHDQQLLVCISIVGLSQETCIPASAKVQNSRKRQEDPSNMMDHAAEMYVA